MYILVVQQRFIDAGYQFREEIFNDGSPSNCSIKFSKSKSPSYFSRHCMGDFGWGRFPRMYAWRQAAEWLDKVESGELPEPVSQKD